MSRAVLQYSHCTSDTTRRLGAQARRAGHVGRRQALGAGRHGRVGIGTLGAQACEALRHGSWRCDTAGPRATIRPLRAHLGVPGCAQLGQVRCWCT